MSSPLEAVRKHQGLSQAALADRSGISERTIKRLEADPSRGANTGTLVRLAEALGVPLVELIGADADELSRATTT